MWSYWPSKAVLRVPSCGHVRTSHVFPVAEAGGATAFLAVELMTWGLGFCSFGLGLRGESRAYLSSLEFLGCIP